MQRLMLAMLMVALTMAPGHAQVKVSSAPVSRDTITLRLVVDGTPAEVTVQNGGLARVARKGGPAVGLIPVIVGHDVDLMVIEILTDPTTGNEGARQFARLKLSTGRTHGVDASPLPLEVELLRTAPPSTQSPQPEGPCMVCCVTCGDQTVCACVVIMECGMCCCSGVCPCPFSPGGGATCHSAPVAPTVASRQR